MPWTVMMLLLAGSAGAVGPWPESTHPLWLDGADYQKYRSTPALPSTADVVVIGAGIAGVSAAYELSQLNVSDVVVLDARGVCGGASGRNSGGVGAGIDWDGAVQQYGIDRAFKLLNFSVEEFTRLIELNTAPDCTGCWIRVGGGASLYTSKVAFEQDASQVRREIAAGVRNQSVWNAEQCQKHTGSPFLSGCTASTYSGNVWACRFVFTLMRRALKTGRVNLQTQTLVTRVESAKGAWTVHTDRGVITARKVVFATNAYTRDLLEEGEWITPTRGQILMTNRLKMMWEFDVGIDVGDIYMHQQPTGEVLLGGMRKIVAGGETGLTDDNTTNPIISGGLLAIVPGFFPQADGATKWREWTGIMGFSKDGRPLVGPLLRKPGVFLVAGFTGGGIQNGFLFGRAVAAMVATGSPPQWWSALSFHYDQYLASRAERQ